MLAQNLQSAYIHFKFDTGFSLCCSLTCLVNMTWFIPVLACFVIFTCLYFSKLTMKTPLGMSVFLNVSMSMRSFWWIKLYLRPTLKSCLFPIHQTGEIKNSHSFMLIHHNLIMMLDINQSLYLCLHTNKTN